MYTTTIKGEPWEGRMKTLISIVESVDHRIRLRRPLNWSQRSQISTLNLNWDELAINL